MEINKIKFPSMLIEGPGLEHDSIVPVEFQQINQSSIFAYLGIRGLGKGTPDSSGAYAARTFNAIPFLAYWDIFKNYYSNKMEDSAYVVHGTYPAIASYTINNTATSTIPIVGADMMKFTGTNLTPENIQIQFSLAWHDLKDVFDNVRPGVQSNRPGAPLYVEGSEVWAWNLKDEWKSDYPSGINIQTTRIKPDANLSNVKPELYEFTLADIDLMRNDLLAWDDTSSFLISKDTTRAPYSFPFQRITTIPTDYMTYAMMGQEGLAVKTYQSDIFNNWVNSEMIDGDNGIAAVTAISTAEGSFTLDTLNISQKVYNLLTRIAASGGTYNSYIEVTYDHKSVWREETPMYLGGLSKEIAFQEVVSQSATADEPLGSLAGKGIMLDKHKGGHIIAKIDEPGFLIGIISLTPRVDYSQGNEWFTNLKSLDDLHKPQLDGIGFQDLITDQMAFGDTSLSNLAEPIFNSAGKQPAWLNYMTNYNRAYGNFADERSQMFMTLNRRYDIGADGIIDLTTYIDPAKFNYAFAQTDLSAQNFWAQVGVNITARRKMSAQQIPNL